MAVAQHQFFLDKKQTRVRNNDGLLKSFLTSDKFILAFL